MTVLDFLRLMRRSWRLLALGLLAGLIVAAGVTFFQPKVYTATSAGYVSIAGQNDMFAGTEAATNRASSYIPLITSRPVFEKIAAEPGIDLGGQTLEGRLSASVAPGSSLLQVTAQAPSGEAAAALANGALTAMADVIADIEREGGSVTSLKVVPLENAVVPSAPTSPHWPTNLIIGGLAGLVLAFSIALIRRVTDVKVRSVEQLRELTNAGSLARIPDLNAKGKGSDNIQAVGEEAFRRLRTNLRFASVDNKVSSVVITSANLGEGKTTVSTSLARAMAESGQPTIIVDGDLRRPRVAKALDVDDSLGLSAVLSGQVSLGDAMRATTTRGLYVLPAGQIPPNPSEMLGSDAMRHIIAELSRDHFVVVDAPPLLPVTDAALVAVNVDGAILVAGANQTRKDDVTAALHMLEQVHARFLGSVLNRASLHGTTYGYEYKRNNSYYAVAAKQAAAVQSGAAQSAVPASAPAEAAARRSRRGS